MKVRLPLTALSAMVLCLFACDLLRDNHFTEPSRSGSGRQGGKTPSEENHPPKEEKPQSDTIVYVSAIRFPEGYDWQTDTLPESIPREIVLLKNGLVSCSVPVGYEFCASGDPDMHRILDGHLYSDFSLASETVILRDGAGCIRFSGREAMYGFLTDGGENIWTLGQDRSGRGGVTLRKNGAAVFHDPSGFAFGSASRADALFMNEGKVSFFYFRPEPGALSQERRCFMVEESLATEIVSEHKFGSVLDIKKSGGELMIAGLPSGKEGAISLLAGNRLVTYKLDFYDRVGSCRIISGEGSDNVFLSGLCYRFSNGKTASFFCDRTGQIDYLPTSDGLVEFFSGNGHLSVVKCFVNYKWISLVSDGKAVQIDGRHSLISQRCGTFLGDEFYIGLNPRGEGARPYIYTAAKKTEIDINGFITEVKISVEDKQ